MSVRLLLTLLVTTAISVLISPSPSWGDDAAPASERETYLREVVDSLGADGGAYAVVRDTRIAEVVTTGTDGAGDPVTEHTPAYLGSVSKPLLATVAVDLAKRGAVDLDAPVSRTLPTLADIDGAEDITARQLLAHRSGLPFGAHLLDVDDSQRSAADVVARLDLELESKPGERYAYSSLGYLVLTAWLEEETGEPLGVLYDRLHLPDLDADEQTGDQVSPGRRGPWLPATRAPFDGAGLGYGYSAGSIRTLGGLAAHALRHPTQTTAMTATRPSAGETTTGLGWRVTNDDGQRRVWHTGTVPGYFTAVHILPEQNLAVVLWINRSGYLDEQRLYDASIGLLDSARGEPATAPDSFPTPLHQVAAVVLVTAAIATGALLSRRRILRIAGGVLTALVLTAPMIATLAIGVPLRYAWLWLPDVVALTTATSLGLVVVGMFAARRRAGVAKGGGRRGDRTPDRLVVSEELYR